MAEFSPFLHRDERQQRRKWIAPKSQTYRERHTPSAEAQHLKIETYRYRWYERTGSLGRSLLAVKRSPLAWSLAMLAYGSLVLHRGVMGFTVAGSIWLAVEGWRFARSRRG